MHPCVTSEFYALSGRPRRKSFINELLNAIPLGFADDDVALRVGCDAVSVKELTGLTSWTSDVSDQFERIPVQDVDAVV